MSATHLTAVPTSGQSVYNQKRELGEVINYAITAFKKKVPVQSIFALTPTDATGYLAAYIQGAMEYHFKPWVLRQPPEKRVHILQRALRAHRDGAPFDMLDTVKPTANNVAMAAFIDQAIMHHMAGAATQ